MSKKINELERKFKSHIIKLNEAKNNLKDYKTIGEYLSTRASFHRSEANKILSELASLNNY